MREIPLSRGLLAVVDDADYERVIAAAPWSASVKPGTAYALRGVRRPDGRWTTIRLHNFLTGWPFVDHINGNGLDNRRCNLRPADKTTNGQNRTRTCANTSGYKGVTWHKQGRKWAAQLQATGRRIHLGLFDSKIAAALAYDDAARRHFGEFARLNFPLEVPSA